MDIYLTICLLVVIGSQKASSVTRCKFYDDPKNGYVTCDSLFHLFCSPECHPGFRFATKPAVVYMCGPVTGDWFTYPVGSGLPWPDCIPDDRKDYSIQEELARKRDEIAKHIAVTNKGIPTPYYSQAKHIDPEERYHHLFDYIEKAQKAYEYREAIEKETEKLKQEIDNTKLDNAAEVNNVPSNYQLSNSPVKTRTSFAKDTSALIDRFKVSNNVKTISKDDSQRPVKSGLQVQRDVQTANPYKTPWNPSLNTLQQQKGQATEGLVLNENSLETVKGDIFQGPNVQRMHNTPVVGNRESIQAVNFERNTSPFKKDSNFVFRMLNNEEFKDLNYLNEHVRFHRDAQSTSKRNFANSNSKSKVKIDVLMKQEGSANNRTTAVSQQEPFQNSTVLGVKDTEKKNTNSGLKENGELLSNQIVPIVMSRSSIIDSITSLLEKNDNQSTNDPFEGVLQRMELDAEKNIIKKENAEDKVLQNTNPTSYVNSTYSKAKPQIQTNKIDKGVPHSSKVEPPKKPSVIELREIYKAWLKKLNNVKENITILSQGLDTRVSNNSGQYYKSIMEKQNKRGNLSLNGNDPRDYGSINTKSHIQEASYTNELLKDPPSQKKNPFPLQRTHSTLNLYASNNSLNYISNSMTDQQKKSEDKFSPVKEHFYYFPIKKDSLFKLFNQTKRTQ